MSDERAVYGPHGVERRKSPRLRKLIDDMQAGIQENRTAIEALQDHVSGLLHDVDAVQRAVKALQRG